MKAGRKNINGSLEYYSILPVYIKVIVKTSDGKTKKYTTKVADYNKKSNDKRNWTIALDNKLKKGDNVIVSAYVKDYIVKFTKTDSNVMNVFEETVPNSTWNAIKKTISSEDESSYTKQEALSPKMCDIADIN